MKQRAPSCGVVVLARSGGGQLVAEDVLVLLEMPQTFTRPQGEHPNKFATLAGRCRKEPKSNRSFHYPALFTLPVPVSFSHNLRVTVLQITSSHAFISSTKCPPA